jgi:hypothetical protein
MRRIMLALMIALSGFLTSEAQAENEDLQSLPGYFDFKLSEDFSNRETSVEVYVKEPLLSIVRAATRREEPELSELLSRIKLISVRTFSLESKDIEPIKAKVAELDTKLNQEHWEKIVRVKDAGEQVFIYLKSTEGNIDGMVVIAIEYGDEAAFVNIVGNITPENLERLYGRFNIPELDSMSAPTNRRTHEERK